MTRTPLIIGAYTTLLDDVEHTEPGYVTYADAAIDHPGVYVHIKRGEQETHKHLFDSIEPSGAGSCTGCGAQAWSAQWVRVFYMGDQTLTWIAEQAHANYDMVEHDGYNAVQSILSAEQIGEPVVATLDPDEPARLVGARGSVPAMERGVLAHQDYWPDES